MLHVKNSRFELWLVAFVLSAGMLAYEILLTRVASVILTSDYLFVVLAFALLGLAVGAIVEYFIAEQSLRFDHYSPGFWLAISALAITLSIVILVLVGPSGGLPVLILSAALPFVIAGFVFSRIFRLNTDIVGSLYAADLVGAATGALSVPLLLQALGPVQSILLFAAIQATVGGVIVTRGGRFAQTLVSYAAMLSIVGLIIANWSDRAIGPIPVGQNPNKDLFRLVSSEVETVETVDSRWSTFGRTDLVRFDHNADSMSIFIDGAAGSPMYRFDGDVSGDSSTLRNIGLGFSGSLVFAFMEPNQKDHALVIGSGGGRDVLVALQAGFKKITAIEINPQMVSLVKDYKEYNGGVYTDFPQVEVIVDEGRRYLRASEKRYDLITLFMPVTKSSRGLNVFALSENHLFTVEAFRDYHRHLTEEGMLLIVAHGMVEAVKLTTTAVEALVGEGLSLSEAMDHLYVLGSHMMPLFVLTKRELNKDQSDRLHDLVHTPMFDSQYSYIPGVKQDWYTPPASASDSAEISMMNPLLYNLAEGDVSMKDIESGLGINLKPAKDDRPFFFQYGLGPPLLVSVMLWVAILSLVAIVFVPFIHMRHSVEGMLKSSCIWVVLWFISIGLGFIVLELVLFQKLGFFLGDPSRSLAVLLASLLSGSGIGSLVASKMSDRTAVAAGLAIAVGALVVVLLIPWIFDTLQAFDLSLKLAIAGMLLALVGVPMGMMFPIGLRVANRVYGPRAVPWMWSINGAASVAGSGLAIAVAMSFGYNYSLALGATFYLLAAYCAFRVPIASG